MREQNYRTHRLLLLTDVIHYLVTSVAYLRTHLLCTCLVGGVVVERWSLTGELSLSCARLLAGWMITLWVRRPLPVANMANSAIHPSLMGR